MFGITTQKLEALHKKLETAEKRSEEYSYVVNVGAYAAAR